MILTRFVENNIYKNTYLCVHSYSRYSFTNCMGTQSSGLCLQKDNSCWKLESLLIILHSMLGNLETYIFWLYVLMICYITMLTLIRTRGYFILSPLFFFSNKGTVHNNVDTLVILTWCSLRFWERLGLSNTLHEQIQWYITSAKANTKNVL